MTREQAIDAAVVRVAKRVSGKTWRALLKEWLTREPLFTTRRAIVHEFNEIVAA